MTLVCASFLPLASRVRWVHAAGLVVPVVSALRLSRAGRCSVVVSAAGGWGCTRSLIRPSAVYRFSHWRTRSARSCVPGPSPHTVSTSIHASPAPHSYCTVCVFTVCAVPYRKYDTVAGSCELSPTCSASPSSRRWCRPWPSCYSCKTLGSSLARRRSREMYSHTARRSAVESSQLQSSILLARCQRACNLPHRRRRALWWQRHLRRADRKHMEAKLVHWAARREALAIAVAACATALR